MQLAITEKYLEDVCPIVRVILQDFQYAVWIWQLVRVFYYNLVKFHSNHKNIFLERKNEKKKGFMYYCFPFQQSQWFQPFLHLALLFFSMSSFFIWIIGDILKPTGVENYKLKKTSFSTDITESEGIPVTVFFPELSK